MPQFPLPLCITASFPPAPCLVFLPVPHQESCIPLFSPIVMLRGWQGSRGLCQPGEGGQHWVWRVSTATRGCFCTGWCSRKTALPKKKTQALQCSRVSGWEGSLLSLCSSGTSLSSIAFTTKLWGKWDFLDCGQKVLTIMGALECGQRLGTLGWRWLSHKELFDYGQSTQDQVIPGLQDPNPLEKIPSDKPSVFAAHWLPSPAHPSSAAAPKLRGCMKSSPGR